MISEEREKIVSNDFADLIINYGGDPFALKKYQNDFVQIINYFLAVVHVPVSQITDQTISRLGYAVMPSLFGLVSEASLEASGIVRLRNIPNFDLRGRGVLIGFVDTGIDYTNPIFQYADKTTKILSIWDQTIVSNQLPVDMNYGTEYTRDQINEALISDNPFRIVPSKDEIGHGTMLAGIAAGNEVPDNGFYGVAPDAELLIVKLKPAKTYLKEFFRIPENVPCYQENDILFGYQYLINYASKLNKPIVICIALDTSQYAHDGRGTTSSWLSIQAIIPGIAIIIGAGNEGNARRHYHGIVDKASGFDTVELHVGENESGFSMELWGASPNIYSIDIVSPTGEYVPRIDISFDETRIITFIFEATIINLDYQMVESQSGDQLILLRFSNPTQGIWRFKVFARGVFPISFNIWLPMNGFLSKETYFIKSDPYTTILSLSCAEAPITVTAYNVENDNLYVDAGRGYSRIDIIKPEIAAPGVNILSPTLEHGFVPVTGTSAATAHTAGIAAMLLEWGIIKENNINMNTTIVKIFMIRGARRDIDKLYPNRDWGYGILDIFNVYDIIRRSQ